MKTGKKICIGKQWDFKNNEKTKDHFDLGMSHFSYANPQNKINFCQQQSTYLARRQLTFSFKRSHSFSTVRILCSMFFLCSFEKKGCDAVSSPNTDTFVTRFFCNSSSFCNACNKIKIRTQRFHSCYMQYLIELVTIKLQNNLM